MRKYLVALAVLLFLPASVLFCQEEEESMSGIELSIIPRIDLGYDKGAGHPNLGNSSLYTLFEANITDNLFFSMENHWAGIGLDEGAWDKSFYTDLYRNLGRSDQTNWLDLAYLCWSLGDFEFTVGKSLLFSEGMEGDEYDFDVHPILSSSYWNNFAAYQWGADIAWTNRAGNTTLAAQFVSSPYGEHPFSSGLYSYGLKWIGEYGPLYNIWTVSFIDTGDGCFPLVSLGQAVDISEHWNLSLDWWNAVCDEEALLLKGHSAYGTLGWAPSGKFKLLLKGGYEYASDKRFAEVFNGYRLGGALHWFPLEGMRVHAAAGYNDADRSLSALIGVAYQLKIRFGGK